MRKIVKIVSCLCIAAGISCMLAACGGGGDSPSATAANVTSTSQSQIAKYSLSATSVSNQGDIIPITFSITNTSNSPVTFYIPILVSAAKDNVQVWYSSVPNTGSTAFRGINIIQPGETSVITSSWNQNDVNGNQVAKGNYVLAGTYYCNADFDIEQVTITIQ